MSIFSQRTKSSSTPSSILKRTTNLKTRLSQISSTPVKVRFVLPYQKKVRNILQDYKNKVNSKEYESLVCMIRDAELLDEDVSGLLKEATECISLMNQDLHLFVEALLSITWVDKHKSVIKEYQSFIVNLISAHNYHAEFVIDKLVSLFIPTAADPEWKDGVPRQEDIKKCVHIHSLLSLLLSVVPMCKEILMHSLINQFPYMKKSTHIHEYYLHNLLWVIEYQPTMRPDILHLIFSKLVIMDVNAPRQDIEKLLYENEDDDIFAMDDYSKSIKSTDNYLESVHLVAHSLDVCLDKILDFVYNACHDGETGQLIWDQTKNLYQDLLTVFEQVILPTYNTHHVQFILFLICTLKPAIAEAFLNFLWKKAVNPNVASVLRQACVNYIVSFLARANFISLSMLKGSIQQMAEWIHSYTAIQDGLESVNSDVRAHTVFYTVCQALFYVIAFRHRDLVTKKKNIVFLGSLNLAKIVTSRLNPLRVCQPAVVQNFAAVTRKYQLAYCYAILEHNARNTLPTIYRDERGTVTLSTNVLDACYPFDPFVLPRSGEKVHPHYRDYTEVNLDSENVDVDMKDLGDNNTDDFLENEISPSTATNRSSKFSYGTSPGFKFKG